MESLFNLLICRVINTLDDLKQRAKEKDFKIKEFSRIAPDLPGVADERLKSLYEIVKNPARPLSETARELLEKWSMHVLVKIEKGHEHEAPPPWRGLI